MRSLARAQTRYAPVVLHGTLDILGGRGRAGVLDCVRRAPLATLFAVLFTVLIGATPVARANGPEAPPNVVVILCDDLGYGDLGSYGGAHGTPNIDRIGREGVRCTDFYVAQPVCSASRAALLTGCYPNRIGIAGALGPNSKVGIAASETTLAELAKSRGYATAIFGKWHLGDAPEFSPLRHGFDEFYGLPYSNDMWPHHPERPRDYPPLRLFEQDRVVVQDVTAETQATLTGEITRHAVSFIERHAKQPFFLYVPHPMPHVPLFTGADFAGKSGKGRYGDVIAELDWSTGEILAALDRCGVASNTIVVFLSDNGPWLSYGDHAGSAGPLREGKGTTWEGGVRVPCLVRWPGRVDAGSTFARPAMTIDWLPTIARAMGAERANRAVDGVDLAPWLFAQSAQRPDRDPHEALAFYYNRNDLEAIRSGRWKLILPHSYRTLGDQAPGRDGVPAPYRQAKSGLELYDLATDIGEHHECSAEHADVVARLMTFVDEFRGDLGDDLTKTPSTGARASGFAPRSLRHPDHPNIVLFLVDDLGWQDTSVSFTDEPTPLNRRWRTPNVERLAERGMRFTNAYASAPVCTPTRTAILTGKSPARSHITYWIRDKDKDASAPFVALAPPAWEVNGLRADAVTLPALLRGAGYRTIHVGKAHVGAVGTPTEDPRAIGYDVNIAGHGAGAPGSYYGLDRFADNVRKGAPDAGPSVWDVPGLERYHGKDVFLEEALAQEAVAAIDAPMRSGTPFFLAFCPYAVHAPIMPNKKLLEHYPTLDATEAAYATMIETVDAALGTIVKAIDDAGELDETIIVFTSDNGGLSAHARGAAPDGTTQHRHNAPAKSGKGSAYDGGLRVPLVVAWPGAVAPNSRNATPVVSHDLFPTILAMAGVEMPASLAPSIDGANLVPILTARERSLDASRAILWHQPHFWGVQGPGIEPFSAIRVGDWKLIAFHASADVGPRFELYDLGHDIGEGHDLAATEPERLASMRARLVEALDATGAQMSVLKATGEPVNLRGTTP